MNLIEAFEKNLLNIGEPQRTIDSIISKIFFINNKVYKVYKYESNFAGDFGSLEFRKGLYSEEFRWNSIASPDVYLSLNFVTYDGKEWKSVNQVEDASDFYIVMNELPAQNNVIELLLHGRFSDEQVKQVASYSEQVITDLEKVNQDLINSGKGNAKANLRDVLIDSFSDWAKLFNSPNLDNELISKTMKLLTNFFDSNPYFQNYDVSRLTVGLDNHALNMFFFNEKPQYIDIYPPVKKWLVSDKLLNVALISSAFSVFLGKEKGAVFYKTSFGESYSELSEVIDFYEIRYCLAQGMYYQKIERPEIAVKFLDFVRSKVCTDNTV